MLEIIAHSKKCLLPTSTLIRAWLNPITTIIFAKNQLFGHSSSSHVKQMWSSKNDVTHILIHFGHSPLIVTHFGINAKIDYT